MPVLHIIILYVFAKLAHNFSMGRLYMH